MNKRGLAIWPLAVPKPKAKAEVRVELTDPWNQEEEIQKLNRHEQVQTAQEQIDRLVPGLEFKRLVL